MKLLEKNFDGYDSGDFAYPARAKEELQALAHVNEETKPSVETSQIGRLQTLKNSFDLLAGKIPPILLLFRKNKINYVPMYYPQFFWRLRKFSIFLVWVNSIRKHGIKHAGEMLLEYCFWKISELIPLSKDKTTAGFNSLRKVINKPSSNAVQPIS